MGWLSADHFDDVRVSLSSVRASTVTPELRRTLASRGSRSITTAVESSRERMRKLVNKKLSHEQILAAARYAREGGLTALKLYGMVGLPQ